MKVKADRTVRYQGKSYTAGQEFEIAKEDYAQHKDILTIIEQEETVNDKKPESEMVGNPKLTETAQEALEGDNNGGSGNITRPVNKKTPRKK